MIWLVIWGISCRKSFLGTIITLSLSVPLAPFCILLEASQCEKTQVVKTQAMLRTNDRARTIFLRNNEAKRVVQGKGLIPRGDQ